LFSKNPSIQQNVGYCSEILQDATQYADHSQKDRIDLNDLKLAIQARVNTSFTPAPSREVNLF
jgi:transcription initiation factor TFIID subunit 9B